MKKRNSPKRGQQLTLFTNELAPRVALANPSRYSDYIVYVDESGDHSLTTVDEKYPVFVLAFCVFNKRYYAETIVPRIENFKFRHFGHDVVVLHETDIRKERGKFSFSSREHKDVFMGELTDLIDQASFIVIASAIEKRALKERSSNPYHLALGFCLESLRELMIEKSQENRITHIVVEARGPKEDNELELEFRRICGDTSRTDAMPPFEIIFADKKTNSSGLQLADLVARPIGLSVIRPKQPNRSFEVLKAKFLCRGGRHQLGKDYEGLGLKIHPAPDSEKPR